MPVKNAWNLKVKVRNANFYHTLISSTQLSLIITDLTWALLKSCFGQVWPVQLSLTVWYLLFALHSQGHSEPEYVLHTVKISQAPFLICVTVSNRGPEVSWQIFMRAVCGAGVRPSRNKSDITWRTFPQQSLGPGLSGLGGGDYSGSTVIWVALSSSASALTPLHSTIFQRDSFQSAGPHLPLQSL